MFSSALVGAKVKDAPQEDRAVLCYTAQSTSSVLALGYQF